MGQLSTKAERRKFGPQIVDRDDTKNEIDDQFAIVYSVLADTLSCEAIYAAPFVNASYNTAAEGMEASYREIHTVLELMGTSGRVENVLKGSDQFISDTQKPQDNPAVRDLIQRCRGDERVIVVAIGALTNIASALMLEPSIAYNMILLWLGGHPEYWPTAREFNLTRDVAAAHVVFQSGVPFIHFPCKNVAEHIRSVPEELRCYIRHCGPIGEYLTRIFADFIPGEVRSKPIWDLAPLAWLVNKEWVPTKLMPTPKLNSDLTWDTSDANRPLYRIATDARRDLILGHFVRLMQQTYGHNKHS